MFQFNIYYLFLLISGLKLYYFPTQAFRIFYENAVEIIMAVENEIVDMECKTDMPIAYCGFIHSDTRYSFSGPATNVGKCSIKIKATVNQTGEWRCNIGSEAVGEESTKIIELRVVKEIAAMEKNIKTWHGSSQTLYCTTTRGFIPLSYCRFEPPKKLPFGIDATVTQEKLLLQRYYFPANKSLDRGDCAVTIQKVNYEDVGVWTCGAGFNDGTEHTDIINFDVEGFSTLSVIAITAITVCTITALALLFTLLFIAYKRRKFLGIHDVSEAHELQQAPSRVVIRQDTPEPRVIPTVIVQSPSDPGTGSSLMPATDE